MRVDIDQHAPWLEQFSRCQGRKVSGRKHKKRMGQKAIDRNKAHIERSSALKNIKGSAYKIAVAEFWRGNLDKFPAKSDFQL